MRVPVWTGGEVLVIAEAFVSKDKRPGAPKPGPTPNDSEPTTPDVEAGEPGAKEYTEHVLVPIAFKERLERIAQRVNQDRRRKKLPKRPLGWFVVTHLADWMAAAEAQTAGET